jgi:hypothetical protein
LQGQVSNAPYIGLWTRLETFQRAELTSLLEERTVIRASSLRNTLHILAAEDYFFLHPMLRNVLNRQLHLFARNREDFNLDSFTAHMRAYIREQPRTAVELRAEMEACYPGLGKQQLADALRMHLALVQPAPAGTWNFTGKPTHVEATAWLGATRIEKQADPRQLILRYLAAFGPASVKDIQLWSGARGLQHTLDELRPILLTFRDEQGKELFDLPQAPRPAAETPAPVRFLPDFENLLLSYVDRRRIIADKYRPLLFTGNSRLITFLVDGFVGGTWKIERQPASITLIIQPFEPLSQEVQRQLSEEGEQLLHWIEEDAESYEIQFVPQQQ